jgi:hypothetical protein
VLAKDMGCTHTYAAVTGNIEAAIVQSFYK